MRLVVGRLRSARLAGLVVLGMVLGGLIGVYSDQHYPDLVPLLGPGASKGQVDDKQLKEVERILRADYYDPKFDGGRLTQGSLAGMVAGLGDPYSQYRSPQDYAQAQSDLRGQFTGIGIYSNFRSEYPVIVGVEPNSPADRAGLHVGDSMVRVDGRDLRGMTADQVTSQIRGPAGKPVTLIIHRGDQELSMPIVRARYTVPDVRSTRLEHDVLYIHIRQFGENTSAEFDQALKSGLPGAGGLLLDLRNDGGGLIDAAASVISRFVDHGDAFQLRFRDGHVEHQPLTGDHPALNAPVVVLVNGNTASAAEMVSGALRVDRHANLVGEKTYGKGSVQADFPLSNGGDVHLTIKHWLLPNGDSVDKNGLVPDVGAKLTSPDDIFDLTQQSLDHTKDGQLNRALQLLPGG